MSSAFPDLGVFFVSPSARASLAAVDIDEPSAVWPICAASRFGCRRPVIRRSRPLGRAGRASRGSARFSGLRTAWAATRPRVYPDEFRERAVRLLREWREARAVEGRPAGGVQAVRPELPRR